MNQPLSPPCGEGRERTLRTFIAPCAPEPAGVRSARRPGAQRVRMQPATWGGFRHEQAVGAAATGDRSRSRGGFMERERAIAALGRVTNWWTHCGAEEVSPSPWGEGRWEGERLDP